MQDAEPLFVVCGADEVPTSDHWLSPEERAVLDTLHVPPRRADFRLGRWTAKRALDLAYRETTADDPPEWCVRAAEDGAPEAFAGGDRPAPFAISLSHRAGLAAATAAPAGVRVGVDLELVEPRSDAMIEQFFTRRERERLADEPLATRALAACLVWSAKESVLKAERTGLRADTRELEVDFVALPVGGAWTNLRVTRRVRPASGRVLARLLERPSATWVLTWATLD